jgi:hypothetical protein
LDGARPLCRRPDYFAEAATELEPGRNRQLVLASHYVPGHAKPMTNNLIDCCNAYMRGDRNSSHTLFDALPQHPELCEYTEPIARTSLLDVAIWIGDIEMIGLLLSVGMNPDSHREGHDIPLITALSSPAGNAQDMIRILVLHGADVNHRGVLKESAMHAAVALSSVEFIDVLLNLGADIDIQHFPDKCTPLWYAVLLNDCGMVDALLLRGANPEIRNSVGGSTPLDVAINQGNESIIKRLLNADAYAKRPGHK